MFRPRHALLVIAMPLALACGDSASQSKATAPAAASHEHTLEDRTDESQSASAAVRPAALTDTPEARLETITFPAADGLPVTADLYLYHGPEAPFLVLFHQAGWSRGEYTEIAPRLGALGFNAMAVDQRSGKSANGIDNQTYERAVSKKLPTGFIDALPDMRAALELVAERYPKAKRIAWGSSYSSALVLYLAGTEPELMDAALAFAPGEYFERFGKSKSFIADAAKTITVPTFIASARDEAGNWKAIYAAIPGPKSSFIPKSAGNHGSRALWARYKDSAAYWQATEAFLSSLK